MLRGFVIQSWIDYECSTSIAKFTPVTKIFFLLNKICDGASSKEPFLKAATLAILIWAYLREMRTSNWNFKKAAILPSKIAHAWRACALIWPLCALLVPLAPLTATLTISSIVDEPSTSSFFFIDSGKALKKNRSQQNFLFNFLFDFISLACYMIRKNKGISVIKEY